MEDEVDAHAEIPFRFIRQIFQEQANLNTPKEGSELDLGTREGENTGADNIFMRGIVDADILPDEHEENGVLLEHESGIQVYIGRDSTSIDLGFNELFGFVLFDGTD